MYAFQKGGNWQKNTLISFPSIMDDLREHFKVKEGGKGSETFLATYLKGFQPFLFLDAFRKQKFLLSSLSSFYCLKKWQEHTHMMDNFWGGKNVWLRQ